MKPQLIKRSLIENLYKENNKKVFNSINFQNNVFFNILIIFFLLFCLIFLFYRYSNNKLYNNNNNEIDDEDSQLKSNIKNENYNKKIDYQYYTKEKINSHSYSKALGTKGSKQKFVNNKISDYFLNDNSKSNMLGDIQKYKELSNKYNLE
jgi:Ca2+/Na+ antiporter